MVQTIPVQTTHEALNLSYPSGFDGGNTDTCFSTFVGGQERTVILPSTLTEIIGNKLATLRGAVASTVDGERELADPYQQDLQVTYQNKTYLLGYSAMRQAKRANTQKGDATRYASVEHLIRLLAASALAITDHCYELDLVTTVPYGYYTKALRQQIKQTFNGSHEFALNGVERQACVRVRQILVEGAPGLVLYGASSATTRRLLIDGGGHTTELLTFDGRDPIAELCRGVELGVETIGDYIAEQLLEGHGRRLSLRERSDILRAYGSRMSLSPFPYPVIACGSYAITPAELQTLCHAGAIHLSEAILSEAAMLWGKVNGCVAGDITYQYQLGGSVYFCNEIMREKMPGLLAVADAEKANARGCARIARALV
ncbi:MAG TPA: ParM/StbA family protein [Ktedonosporobacter sp.]|nr:ParM/StbA family protein [Ktedonosporobacter sp.]